MSITNDTLRNAAQTVLNRNGLLTRQDAAELEHKIRTGPIYIGGSQAKFAQDMIAYAAQKGLNAFIIDDFHPDDTISGFPRLTSAEFLNQSHRDEAIMVLCSFSAKGRNHYISLANKANIPLFDYLTCAQTLPDFPQDHMLENLTLNTAKDIGFFLDNMSLFDDEASQQTYKNILLSRLTLDYPLLEKVNQGHERMYLGNDFIHWLDGEYIVDGGAYDGDTARSFLSAVPGIKKIYAFEPDPGNFHRLEINFSNDHRVKPYPYGLWNKKDSLSFSSLSTTHSSINEGNGNVSSINVIDLDTLLGDAPITFIKLDIEGAEKEALQGAQHIISTRKPKMALACYHKHRDLVDLALQLRGYNPDYKFYLRHYGDYFLETVLYAF